MSGSALVALVNMPFSYSKYPSIQLGTLSALLKSQGIPVDSHHMNVQISRSSQKGNDLSVPSVRYGAVPPRRQHH
jgi:hypothetical protein